LLLGPGEPAIDRQRRPPSAQQQQRAARRSAANASSVTFTADVGGPNTVLLALCRRRLSRHLVRLRQQQRLRRSASIERIVVNRLSRSLRPKLRLYFLRLRSGKQAGPPLLSARGRPTAVGSLRGKSDRRQTLQPSRQLRSAIFTFKKVAHTRLPSFGCPS